MFNNIGKKIKTVTVVLLVILCVACFVSGIVICVAIGVWGLYLAFLCPIALLISSFFAYGFGELIENTTKIIKKNGTIARINYFIVHIRS